ncbi:MAG: sigma-70 family RNA polymerase sigma factor [Bacillota bacterium]|nr:sigma-70 family RNA polymerase sigma factor [Bacillota bacterium]
MPNIDSYEKADMPKNPSDAIESIMTYYGSVVLRTAFFYLGDKHLAEDISQEVFIRAYRSWLNFRGECLVKTWLIKITVNLCRDKMRLKSFSEEPNHNPLILQMQHPIVEQDITEQLNKTIVLKNVLDLPIPYQEVLFHYYYHDLTTKKIAEVTGFSEGTIKSRLHRAKELLRERLKKEGFGYE